MDQFKPKRHSLFSYDSPVVRQRLTDEQREAIQRPALSTYVEVENAVVLIAEDCSKDMIDLRSILLDICRVKFCEGRGSAAHLLGMVAAHPRLKPDLILLDLQIPEEDSFLILEQIHSRPILQWTKIVGMMEEASKEDVERVRVAGFEGLIGKPIDQQRFPGQLRRILAGKSVWEPY